jgi:large subunit ribosomal protein L18Ae
MSARHRVRFGSVQIIRDAEVKSADVRRTYVKQLIQNDLSFTIPHRITVKDSKNNNSTFFAKLTSTF